VGGPDDVGASRVDVDVETGPPVSEVHAHPRILSHRVEVPLDVGTEATVAGRSRTASSRLPARGFTVVAMTTRNRSLTLTLTTGLVALVTAGGSITAAVPAVASGQPAEAATSHNGPKPVATCPPDGRALGFSDALDKKTALGAQVGGLSALTYDKRRHAYAAIEDHSGSDPTRMWFFRDPKDPTVTATLLLSKADRTPYTGDDFDAEGLAILPNGDYLVSSEVEPSIHVFSRSGREKSQLPVPARFGVAPVGQATANATLEGLSLSPDGSRIYAAMEGTLFGDVSASGDATYRRILVYSRTHAGGYTLAKQIGYRMGDGMRISEVATYGHGGLLVLEAAYDPAIGNTIRLVAVPNARTAADVSRVTDLGDTPANVAASALVSDATKCPDLGATAKETQANPLMDNYEAMAVRTGPGGKPGKHAGKHHGKPGKQHGKKHGGGDAKRLGATVLLLSDDNFGDGQTTRLLRLKVALPKR